LLPDLRFKPNVNVNYYILGDEILHLNLLPDFRFKLDVNYFRFKLDFRFKA
jgi:hypothetical protein